MFLLGQALGLAVLWTPVSAANDFASEWADGEDWRTRIVSAVAATGTQTSVPLGLQIKLGEGWHIYWRSPGEAGLPPAVAIGPGSRNVESAELLWPAPAQTIEQGELVTRTYSGDVLIPIRLGLQRPGAPAVFDAVIDYQICSMICIPVHVAASVELPAGAAAPSRHARLIAEAEAQIPGPPEAAGFSALDAAFDGDHTIQVTATSRLVLDAASLDVQALLEGPPGLLFRSGQGTISKDRRSLSVGVEVLRPFDADLLLGSELGLTLVAGPASAYRTVALDGQAPARAPAPGMTLGAAFLLSLLGGMILNLMPCVLPVLGIKVAGVLNVVGTSRARVTASFLATAAGIVASFLALALLVAGIRAMGMTAGWGFQFQVPGFLAFLTAVVLLFAAVLAGLCEFRLPAGLGRWLHGAGGNMPRHAGAFAEGAFATLLATPCTAPIVGTTVGFALSRGFTEILLLFLGLGLGMAVPWLLVAVRPSLLTILPRPGPWMKPFKLVLAAMLFATALWLLSVLHTAAGAVATVLVAGFAVLSVAAFSLSRVTRILPATRTAGVAFVIVTIATPLAVGRPPPADSAMEADMVWSPLVPEAVADLAEDHVVLVDVTAEWCVTCIVNKRLVLNRSPVRDVLETDAVVAIRGDWTLPDPVISAYLADHERYGIPFNAVYGPGLPEGMVLPELLSANAVMDAIERAKGLQVR